MLPRLHEVQPYSAFRIRSHFMSVIFCFGVLSQTIPNHFLSDAVFALRLTRRPETTEWGASSGLMRLFAYCSKFFECYNLFRNAF